MRKIAISAGHNAPYKIACGAVGYLNESQEARNVVRHLIKKNNSRKQFLITDCTINNGKSQQDVLVRCVQKTNEVNADLNVQIHFNAFENETAQGCEVLIYQGNQYSKKIAEKILKKIDKNTGLRNRGVKERRDLYFLNHTANDSIMIEVCFATSQYDQLTYEADFKKIINAIYNALNEEV